MNEAQVITLVSELFGIQPLSALHQTFGHNSVTYDVTLPDRNVIVRTNRNPQVFATTESNMAVLAKLGLPVPNVLAVDITLTSVPFAYMILEKIPGRDLRYELSDMTPAQMTRLAEQIVGFQQQIKLLPPGRGYGYVGIGETGSYSSWWELLNMGSVETAAAAGDDLAHTRSRVQYQIRRFEPCLRMVSPTCFLDDITVKNVICAEWRVTGIGGF